MNLEEASEIAILKAIRRSNSRASSRLLGNRESCRPNKRKRLRFPFATFPFPFYREMRLARRRLCLPPPVESPPNFDFRLILSGGKILFQRIPFVSRGPETTGTRTRPGQMHPQEAQAKPQAENAVYDAAAVIAREKVSRETVPDDSRESRVLVVPPSHGDAGGTCARRRAAN